MSSTIKIKAPAMPEPPLHCIKNIEVNQMTRIGAYKNAATARGALKARGKSPDRFDAVPVYTADQLAARDAQWQEMVGPVVEALKLFVFPYQEGSKLTDAERQSAGRAALSAITEE